VPDLVLVSTPADPTSLVLCDGLDTHSRQPPFSRPKPGAAFATAPNDPFFPYQWNLQDIRALEAWAITQGDGATRIAMVDLGRPVHPDLDGNMLTGHGGLAVQYHPYAVASVMAAVTNNALGAAGVAPNLKVYPVKMADGPGVSSAEVAQGIKNARIHSNAGVMLVSAALMQILPQTTQEIQQAFNSDFLIVCGSGNQGVLANVAADPRLIVVGALSAPFTRWSLSNYGPFLTCVAPGDGIVVAWPGDAYVSTAGTSVSAPHVAAVLALMRSLRPDLDGPTIRNLFMGSLAPVTRPGFDVQWGYGKLDAAAALLAAQNAP
jgi:subtilisin family serine protease